MPSSLDTFLARVASSILDPTPGQQEILERLNRFRARLDEGLLRVAVLGQFKRGKSTLLNALLGVPLLPTGITPVTAIPTFIKAGPKTSARIAFKGDKEPLIASAITEIPGVLERYISETENPCNRLNVENVEIEVRSEFLDQGVVFIDTPGVGSTLLHNTKAAESVLAECDAAVFVISADPPITEVEVDYLVKVQELIPKLFFALNKIDLLDSRDRSLAERFLTDALKNQYHLTQPIRIFCVSAKQALRARQEGDAQALKASGLLHLERVLAGELSREKHAIAFATGRLRSISLVRELLFQSELEQKALLMPLEELKGKTLTFELSVARFETERQSLSDVLSIDRKRLLERLEAETGRLWKEVQKEMRQRVGEITTGPFDEKETRDRLATALSQFFEKALHQSIEQFRAILSERLVVHQERAGSLINLVRQTAADLMEIRVTLPWTGEIFEAKREPYWTAPGPSISLLDMSAGAVARFMPRSIREKWLRDQLTADVEKAVLRNLANIDWAIRQNLEDAFRRYEFSLSEQLGSILQATRKAMQMAIERRCMKVEETEKHVRESARSIAALSAILSELEAARFDLLQSL
ncbi:MAG TPA: dynamin family protein [Methylocella sp.]|nr:dynamin family protein [Methylocella sp.]